MITFTTHSFLSINIKIIIIYCSLFVVNLVDKQLQNSSLNVETKMANTLLKTVSSVLQGVSSSSTDSKTATTTTTTTLLKEAVIIERRKVYQNMIDGTNALAQASIVSRSRRRRKFVG